MKARIKLSPYRSPSLGMQGTDTFFVHVESDQYVGGDPAKMVEALTMFNVEYEALASWVKSRGGKVEH